METIKKLDLTNLDDMINLRLGIQNYDSKFLDELEILISEKELRERTRKYLMQSLNDNLHMFGYFIDDKLIANCGFYIDKHFPTYNTPNGITGYICNVFTLEEYRNKGYQRKLFQDVLSNAKKMGITYFKLSSINVNAIKMYESFGFTLSDHMYTFRMD
ncbi:MAG: GNAT family N-acetyltransferase [Bacilli bacterium]|nr:GNAT family N-acetyltransferase [Bacilli bacterium]